MFNVILITFVIIKFSLSNVLQCSATCGLGQRKRAVFCRGISTEASTCDPRETPHSIEECYSGPCPVASGSSNEGHDHREAGESSNSHNPVESTTISNDIIPIFNQPVLSHVPQVPQVNKWVIEGWSKVLCRLHGCHYSLKVQLFVLVHQHDAPLGDGAI